MFKFASWLVAAILFVIIFAVALFVDGVLLNAIVPLNATFASYWAGVFFWARASLTIIFVAMIVKGAVSIEFGKKNN